MIPTIGKWLNSMEFLRRLEVKDRIKLLEPTRLIPKQIQVLPLNNAPSLT